MKISRRELLLIKQHAEFETPNVIIAGVEFWVVKTIR